MKKLLLLFSHAVIGFLGFAAGIYVLPILTAAPPPSVAELDEAIRTALYSGQLERDRAGSDALHWGEGRVHVGRALIALEGRISPGPDYKLYLTPEFVETEMDFMRIKRSSARVGDIRRFEDFVVPVPDTINIEAFDTVVIWCETFEQFISSARYR